MDREGGVVGTVVKVTIGTIAVYYLYKWLFSRDPKGKSSKKKKSRRWDDSDEFLYLVMATRQYRREFRQSMQDKPSTPLGPPTPQSPAPRSPKKQRKSRRRKRRKPTDSDWVPSDRVAYCPYCNVYLYKQAEVKAHAREWRHLERAPGQGWKVLKPRLMENAWEY